MKRYGFISILIFTVFHLQAQVNAVRYSVKDGLPQMQCMRIYQDNNSYIWVGTKNGLARFDGHQFDNFFQEDGLISDAIIDINEDKQHRIWVLTKLGLAVFQNNKFKAYPSNNFIFNYAKMIIAGEMIFIIEDVDKQRIVKFINGDYQAFFATEEGQIDGMNFYEDKLSFTLRSNDNSTYYVLNKNGKLISKRKYSSENRIFDLKNRIYIRHIYKNKKLKKSLLYRIADNDTVLWQSFSHKIDLWTVFNNQIALTTQRFTTQMPLYLINEKQIKQPVYRYEGINDILFDKEKNIWLATEKGLLKIVPFENFDANSGFPDYVWTVVEDTIGRVWMASFMEPYLYYYQNDSIHRYHQKFRTGSFNFRAVRLQNGNLIFPYYDGYILYDYSTFHHINLPHRNATFSVFEDTLNHNILFGNIAGLISENKNRKWKIDSTFTPAGKGVIMDMCYDKKGKIWFTTRNYLGIIGDTISYKQHKLNATNLLNDSYDNFWIGTDSGLYFFDRKKWIKISFPDLNRMINSVEKLDDNHLVIGGLKGIGILNLQIFYQRVLPKYLSENQMLNAKSCISYYTTSSGFKGEEVAQNAIYIDRKKNIWIPANNLTVKCSTDIVKKQFNKPVLHLKSLLSEENKRLYPVNNGDTICLNYPQKQIHIAYTGISTTNPDAVTYRYQLAGYDKHWSENTRNTNAVYKHLPPGKYHFKLQSFTIPVQSPEKAEFYLIIKPVWWQTQWFKIFVLFFVFGLLAVIIEWYHRYKQRKEQQEAYLFQLQQQSVQSQLYPHLLYNTVSAIGSVIYKENKHKAYDYIVKLARFMRKSLQDSTKLYKSLSDELNFVKNYLDIQKIRFGERFDYQINIDNNVDEGILLPQMIIQTYVENAVKYGLEPLEKNGLLIINVNRNDNDLIIEIRDNGIGVEKAKEISYGTGKGIKIMNEIYKIHNEHKTEKIYFELIDLYKRQEKGTLVIIKVLQIFKNNKNDE